MFLSLPGKRSDWIECGVPVGDWCAAWNDLWEANLWTPIMFKETTVQWNRQDGDEVAKGDLVAMAFAPLEIRAYGHDVGSCKDERMLSELLESLPTEMNLVPLEFAKNKYNYKKDKGWALKITAPVDGVLNQYVQDGCSLEISRRHVAIGSVSEHDVVDRPPHLYVLYDTCYLMSNKKQDNPVTVQEKNVGDRSISNIQAPRIAVTHVLPEEVKMEIHQHLKSDEKGTAASRARLVCAEIIAELDYMDVKASEAPSYTPLDKLLGPDSPTDKALLAWALQTAEEPNTAVFFATLDGGLATEICRMHRERKTRVFCRQLVTECNLWLCSATELLTNTNRQKIIAAAGEHTEGLIFYEPTLTTKGQIEEDWEELSRQ
jgi:hypothetical protein